MELELEDGNKISLKPDSKVHIGRNLGFKSASLSKDRTISTNHLSLYLTDDPIEKYVIKFEVIGNNPICVCRKSDGERRIYRKFETGELRSGDEFTLSIKKPFFCVVKKKEGEINEDEELSFGEIGCLDLSEIDPVEEFGFLVKGHEFDNYSKKQLTDVKKWNWYLEETNGSSDVDDDENTHSSTSKRKTSKRRNRKKDGLEDDDEWTGDSEEENIVAVKGQSGKRPKYFTRSKDSKRPRKKSSVSNNTSKMKHAEIDDDDELEEEDEEDETLGGFIVSEEEVDDEEEDNEESEEEFVDDDEDDE